MMTWRDGGEEAGASMAEDEERLRSIPEQRSHDPASPSAPWVDRRRSVSARNRTPKKAAGVGALRGPALHDAIPDAKTTWLYREQLTRAGALARLFARFDPALAERVRLAMGGQIVDATMVGTRTGRG
jgi:hypothetical protein